MTVEYESLGRPIVTTEDAIRANSYVENVEPSVIKVGDAKGVLLLYVLAHVEYIVLCILFIYAHVIVLNSRHLQA